MYYLYDEFSGKGRGRSSFERCESQETLMAKKVYFHDKNSRKKGVLKFLKIQWESICSRLVPGLSLQLF